MKKTILTVFYCTLILFEAFAQPEEREKTTISSSYLFIPGIGLSIEDDDSGSILTWRDIILQGGFLSVDFPKAPFDLERSSIGVGVAFPLFGYWTDDDANNEANVIHVSTSEALLIEANYEIFNNVNGLSPKFGADFNMLLFKNYDARAFWSSNSVYWSKIEGLVCTYDLYKVGFYGGAQALLTSKPNQYGFAYLKASAQIGIGSYLAFANWIHNDNFKSPISFVDFGMSFRVAGDLEMGVTPGGVVTLFIKGLLFYERSFPGIGMQNLSNGKQPMQLHIFDFTRHSLFAGLKVSF